MTKKERAAIYVIFFHHCGLFLSEDPESSTCDSCKSFTFSSNQGTCAILGVYFNLRHFRMINIPIQFQFIHSMKYDIYTLFFGTVDETEVEMPFKKKMSNLNKFK